MNEIQFYLYDTLTYSNDSLRAWYTNLDALSGDLLVAGQFVAEGNYQGAIQTINGILSGRSLNQDQIDGLSDLLSVYGILNTSKADSISAVDQNKLLVIAYSGLLASGHAKAVLMLNGYDFDPIYYVEEVKERQSITNPNTVTESYKDGFVSVFPNPTSGDLYIHIDSDVVFEVPVIFQMFDLQGRLVFFEKVDSRAFKSGVDIANMSSGIYAYRVMSDSDILKIGKLVIE